MSPELVKRNIEHSFPGIRVEAVESIGEGFDSRAYLVNDLYVFLFPYHENAAQKLKAEIELLPRLQPRLGVQIPDFEHIGIQLESAFPFVGYRKIAGVALEKYLLSSLDRRLCDQLVGQIADFLHELHSFPVKEAEKCGVMISNERRYYGGSLERTRAEVYPLIPVSHQEYIETLFECYLTHDENFNHSPALLHADLSPDHILYDPRERAISGIIDFGDVRVGDPVYDLMYLSQDYGTDFVDALLRRLPGERFERVEQKLSFFAACNAIEDILYWGLDRADETGVQDGMKRLGQQLLKYGKVCG